MNAEMTKREQWRTSWKAEEAASFSGWDFSHLDGRWQEGEIPWDYGEIVREFLQDSMELLDMGTGGGEFLLTLGHPYARTTVTEGYPPNAALCREHLAPLGIRVAEVDGEDPLPFADASFDLVIDRHESFRPEEVYRILKPGGRFITQQVGGQNDNDLSCRLIPGFQPQYPQYTLTHNRALLERVGFTVEDGREVFSPIRFFDTGALVYFAKTLPWEFPGFTVEDCWEQLCRIEKQRQRDGWIQGTEHRFLLRAIKK